MAMITLYVNGKAVAFARPAEAGFLYRIYKVGLDGAQDQRKDLKLEIECAGLKLKETEVHELVTDILANVAKMSQQQVGSNHFEEFYVPMSSSEEQK